MVSKQKRVSFRNTVSARRALHLNDFTEDEYEQAYFSQEDLQRFKDDVLRTVKLMEQDTRLTDDSNCDFCTRGVEYRTKDGNRNRLVNKVAAREAVLTVQESQWDSGVRDHEAIAIAYRRVSARCAQEARLRALKDQQDSLLQNFGVSLNASPISKCKQTISTMADTQLKFVRQARFNAAA